MTTWLLGNYSGWKTAITGAPVTDWVEHYDLSDFNVGIADGFAGGPPGSPYVGNLMKAYAGQSPITYADKITTPTLILVRHRYWPTRAIPACLLHSRIAFTVL
jgi:dipeptidyl aminopeptidase/acylaminoacyl peptidase